MNGYVLGLVAFVAYLAMIAAGRRIGLWRKIDVTFYGPVMLLRTRKGRGLIHKLASRGRFWATYGTAAIVLTVVATVVLTAFAIATIAATGSGHTLLEPSNDLAGVGQPDISPLTVLVYVVVGLGVAALVHELLHGILTIVGGVKLESMGLLLALVPIGAFVEPNDAELKRARRSVRLRIFSAGPAANLVVAALLLVVLAGVLAPSAAPIKPGTIVTAVAEDSPGDVSGIRPWSMVTDVAGQQINNFSEFVSLSFETPGELVSVNITYEGREMTVALPSGIAVTSLIDGPALNAGIKPGMIIESVNGSVIHSIAELESVVENSSRDYPVNITVLKFGFDKTAGITWFVRDPSITKISLTSKWLYYYTHYPSQNREQYRNVSYMAAAVSPFGLTGNDAGKLIQTIAHPYRGARGASGFAEATISYISLPFRGYSPLVPPASDLYGPTGFLSFMPGDVYWVIVNVVYWIFWANLMLGLTNALPALPMDGALVLRDLLKGVTKWRADRLTGFDLAIGRRPLTDRSVDRLMVVLTFLVAVGVLYLILWQIFGPF